MRVGILLSGRGSNMRSLVAAIEGGKVPASVGLVASNREDAAGLEWARQRGLPTACLPQGAYASREAHDQAMLAVLLEHQVEVVCLAGYMRLLGAGFVRAFPGRILNIHPSLLPSFPGLDAQRQALEHGVKVTGATVHLVDEGLDRGPIVLQAPVPVEEKDTVDTLSERILATEHRLYPEALELLCAGRLQVTGRRCRILEVSS